MRVEFAEAFAESYLLLGCEVLIAKKEDVMLNKSAADLRNRFSRQIGTEVDPRNNSAERTRDLVGRSIRLLSQSPRLQSSCAGRFKDAAD